MNQDPFDILRERLIVAAGGRPRRRRGGGIALAAAVIVLAGAAAATAAVTLTGDDEPSKPMTGTLPAPSATPTPGFSVIPGSPPRGTNPPRGSTPNPRAIPAPPGATPGPGGANPPNQTLPWSIPTPVPPARYDVYLMPDLTAGRAGWCVGVAIRTTTMITGGRGCSPAGPPGTNLIAAGGLVGAQGVGYAVVDRQVREVRLSDGRQITPRRDSGVPAGWRVAVWDVDSARNIPTPTFTLHDARGRELASASRATRGPLPTHEVDAKDPPESRCAIRAKRGSGLRATSARLLKSFESLDVVRPSFLSCATTVYYLGTRRFRAAVLLNARDLFATAPPLPATGRLLSVRREGHGWLAVYGGTARQRGRILRALTVEGP